MRRMLKPVIAYFVFCIGMSLSGCSTLSSGVDSVRGIPAAEIQSRITMYEAGKPLPGDKKIGELYAYRSLTKARYTPAFSNSRVAGGIAVEALVDASGWDKFAGVPYLLICPIAFVIDAVVYPYDLVASMKVSEDDLHQALCDLRQARAYGYTESDISMGFEPRAPYLDEKQALPVSCDVQK